MNTVFPTELLSTTTPLEALLLLLVAGHLLGDFLFQTGWMVVRKKEPLILLSHAATVTAVQIAALAPFFSPTVLATVVGVGVVHFGIDRTKTTWRWSRPGALALFFLDQAVHLVVLGAAFSIILRFGPPPIHFTDEGLRIWTLVTVVAATLAVNWTGGSVVVSLARQAPGPAAAPTAHADDPTPPRSGERTGKLERTIALILILLGEWVALAILVVAKTMVRFEELRERVAAERYLTGTLTSLLVAILMGLGLRALL